MKFCDVQSNFALAEKLIHETVKKENSDERTLQKDWNNALNCLDKLYKYKLVVIDLQEFTKEVIDRFFIGIKKNGRDYSIISANDENGARNLYVTHKKDSLWTWPSMLNEYLTSVSDEVYPVLSSDGKSMYFSSRGLYGVGGFDIYVSEWDEDASDWSEPRNMGFPYSSPYDDFLYLDAPEEGHSFFASNRECSRDSIWVYVLEFDNIPVRHSIDDPQELIEICRLEPESEKKK